MMRDPLFRMALILGLLSAVGPFAIDMYLPALPEVATDLHTTEAAAARTLTSYFIVFGFAQMIYGPMADAIGRKKPLVLGVAIFLIGTVAAAMAPSIGWLIFARAIQGLGAATLMAVPRAVIRDMASGPEAAKMMAAIMIVIAISPMLAPLTGSLVMAWGGWREIFAVLGVAAFISLGLILFVLPETLPEDQRQPVRFDVMLAAAKRLLGDRRFMGLTMIGGFGMASFFVFLAAASFVYTKQYGLSETGFSIAFAVNAIGFFTASQFSATISARVGTLRMIRRATIGFSLATFAGFALALAGLASLPVTMATLFVGNMFLGVLMPSAQVQALEEHGAIAGLAASLGGTLQMMAAGLLVVLAGPFLDGTAPPMLGAIALCGALVLVLSRLIPRQAARA